MPTDREYRNASGDGIGLVTERDVDDLRDMEELADSQSLLHNAALRRLYSRHASGLTRLVNRILSSDGDSSDVVQELFVFAWRHADRYDVRRGTVAAWLTMMARSRALDVRRANAASKRQPARDVTQPTSIDAVEYDTPPDHALLHAGIMLLPEAQRTLVDLAYFEGLSHGQIARVTGMPVGTVKTRLRLALQNLRLAVPARTVDKMASVRARLPIVKWLEPRLFPALADIYFVDVADELGRLQRTDWGHVDPRCQGQLDAIWRFVPATAYELHPVRRVIQSGRPEYVPHADGAWQRSVAMSEQHLHFMERVRMRSLICCPLQLNGRLLGSLTVVRTAPSGQTYRDVDLATVGDLVKTVVISLQKRP